MWINVRMGSYGHTRGQDVNEKLTIAEFWRQVVRGVEMEDGFPLPEDWDIDLQSRKKSIDGTSDELITTLFDGGETVYAKMYDADGRERVWDGISWNYHSPGRR
ncbi:hypothetical protein PENSPDRAFT_244547 [Peniophora sp. CONT]|nr:hypothetical protein PENSPDRAFT_244547 [Peniophora sp. CONT]